MGAVINCNGTLLAPEEAFVPAMDHGFLFGDSIYESLRTYRRAPFLLDRHLDRCERSAAGLALEIPWRRERMVAEIRRTFEAAGNEDSLMRIVVTRGVGPLDMHPDTAGPPAVLLYVVPHPVYPESYYAEGVRVHLVDLARASWGGVDPTIKSGSRLANVLALADARRHGAFEALVRNSAGVLTEGTSSNFFLVKDGVLHTSPVRAGLLPGITRQVVLEVAEEAGVEVVEEALKGDELEASQEAFLTSTTKKVMPVREVGERRFGPPGPVTRRMASAFEARVEREIAESR